MLALTAASGAVFVAKLTSLDLNEPRRAQSRLPHTGAHAGVRWRGRCAEVQMQQTPLSLATLISVPPATPSDDPLDTRFSDSWASARGVAGRVVSSRASTLDPAVRVEVHEYAARWRTLVFANTQNPSGNSIQSVVQMQADSTLCDARAVGSDYVKTMVALAFAVLALRDGGRLAAAPSPPCFACLGMGAGSIPSFLRHYAPSSSIEVVELDASVAEAAVTDLGLDASGMTVRVADALDWAHARTSSSRSLDAVFVDIFSAEDNGTPEPFLEPRFLADVRASLAPGGVVVSNFHTTSVTSRAQLERVVAAYAQAFGDAMLVPAQRRGNFVVAATLAPAAPRETLMNAAAAERERRGLLFDAAARLARMATAKSDGHGQTTLDVGW